MPAATLDPFAIDPPTSPSRADQIAARAGRLHAWRDTWQPETDEQEWLFEVMVESSLQFDRCAREEDGLRSYLVQRAALCWDVDRRGEAEELGSRLHRDASRVSVRLRRSRQGCDWLLERWLGLGLVLEQGGTWDEDQVTLAHDLLGTPPELRVRPPWVDAGSPAALVAREVAALEDRKVSGLDELDRLERQLAEAGCNVVTPRPLQTLRRDEAAWMRRHLWARKELERSRKEAPPDRPFPFPPRPDLYPDGLLFEEYEATPRVLPAPAAAPAPPRSSEFESYLAAPPPPPAPARAPAPPAALPFSISKAIDPVEPWGNRRQRRADRKRR
jgi:hypothetical protein